MPNKNVTLRFGNYIHLTVAHVSQGDTSLTWVFQIVDESGNVYAPAVRYAILAGNKPDGHAFAYLCTKVGDTYQLPPSAYNVQMTAVAGLATAELRLIDNNGRSIGTCNFTIDVEEGPEGAVTVASDSSLPAYTTILQELGVLIGKVETLPDDVPGYISDWLEDHISGGQGVAVDNTLTVQGAAADAKAAGDRLKALEEATIETDDTLTIEGAAADAKAVGDLLFTSKAETYVNPSNNTVSGSNFGVAIADSDIRGLAFTPAFSDNSGTFEWELYRTTDGNPVANGSALTLIDSGTANIGSTLNFDTFSDAHAVQIKSNKLRYCARSAGTFAECVVVRFGTNSISSYDTSSYAISGTFTVKTLASKLDTDTTLSISGAPADAKAVGDRFEETDSAISSLKSELYAVESKAISGTSGFGGSGAAIVFFTERKQRLTFKPYFVTNDSGTYTWQLCRTVSGNDVARNETFTVIDSGSANVGSAIYFDAVETNEFISIVGSNSNKIRYGTYQTGFKLGAASGGAVSTDYGTSYSMVGEYSYLSATKSKFLSLEDTALYGKKIVAIGDSLVAGQGVGLSNTWLGRLAERNGMTYVNYGIGGSPLASNGSTGVVDRYASMDNDADYIIVWSGTNDSGSADHIGTENSTDITTFYGALNAICDGLHTKYPTGRIMFITPFRDDNKAQAIMTACKNHGGIPVFNNLTCGGIDWNNAAQTAALCMDTLHLSVAGNEWYSYKIEAFLKLI